VAIKLPEGFIAEAAMAELLDKHVGTLRRWGQIGYGPKRFHLGKQVAYREDGIVRWLEGIEMEQPRERPEPRRRGRPALASSAASA